MGFNRCKLRESIQIKGSYCSDCLTYAAPICCLAAAQEHQQVIKRKHSASLSMVRLEYDGGLADFPSIDMEEGSRSALITYKMTQNKLQIPGPCMVKLTNPVSLRKSHDSTFEHSRIYDQVQDKAVVEVALNPFDGTDPLIYSTKIGTPPFSFTLGMPVSSNAPPPTYLSLREVQRERLNDKGIVLLGLDRVESGDLKLFDDKMLQSQRDVLTDLMPVLSKSGGVKRVQQLPIELYEPRTSLERLADRFSFAPTNLSAAAKETDPVTRLIKTIVFAVGGVYPLTRQSLPFLSLLGETYQGTYFDGTTIEGEQVSIKPPTSRFIVKGKDFTCSGTSIVEGDFVDGVFAVSHSGTTLVTFDDGQIISFELPSLHIEGLETANRVVRCVGEFKFQDTKNCLKAEIRVGKEWEDCNPSRRPIKHDTLLGRITKYVPDDTGPPEETVTILTGSWLEKLSTCDTTEVVIWDSLNNLPCFPVPDSVPLPSDYRYREDLIWLTRERPDYAVAWRTILEGRQNQNLRLRQVIHSPIPRSRSQILKSSQRNIFQMK
jgi:hypothetical protein